MFKVNYKIVAEIMVCKDLEDSKKEDLLEPIKKIPEDMFDSLDLVNGVVSVSAYGEPTLKKKVKNILKFIDEYNI